jgi:hypothetical protein
MLEKVDWSLQSFLNSVFRVIGVENGFIEFSLMFFRCFQVKTN